MRKQLTLLRRRRVPTPQPVYLLIGSTAGLLVRISLEDLAALCDLAGGSTELFLNEDVGVYVERPA